MSLNFKDALDTNVGTIEKPPLPPPGTYIFQITKQPEIQEDVSDGAYDIVNFQCVAVEATGDVDAGLLQEYGALKNISLRHSFLFDKSDQTSFDKSLWSLRRFLEQHVKVEFEGVPLKQALSNSVNQRFMGVVFWKPRKGDAETFDANIKSTAPLP